MKAQIHDNVIVVQQAEDLIQWISDATYGRPMDGIIKGSIGKHVRHNLDHYNLFIDGIEAGQVDYDLRRRDSVIELSRAAALTEIARTCSRLLAIPDYDKPLRLRVRNRTGSECNWVETSVSRELDFLLSHTTHHHALIAVICRMEGIPLEDDFGMAPSTLRHLGSMKSACAR